MAKPKKGLRYIGRAARLGVPRRDLTPDEVKKFGREWLLSLRCANTGEAMYVEETPAEIEIEEVSDGE